MLLKLPPPPPRLRIWQCQLLSEPELEGMAIRCLSMMPLGDKRLVSGITALLHQHENESSFACWGRNLNTVSASYPRRIVSHIIYNSAQHCLFYPLVMMTPVSWRTAVRTYLPTYLQHLYKEHCGISPSVLMENKCFYCWLRLKRGLNAELLPDSNSVVNQVFFLFFVLALLW